MTVAVGTVDRTALPTALLPLAKSHLRVDGTYDDAYITSAIGRAIAKIEDTNGVIINPTTVTWSPGTAEFCNGGATLPAIPAASFTAVAGSPAADVSANYKIVLKWNDILGVPIQTLQGAAAGGLLITLTLGFTDLNDAPALLDRVLRQTAHLYENREILTPGAPYLAPDLELDATWWVPRL
jgi:uncharacterized phiE125 gp8 family phage protein